ncbi:hypothetical protein RND71_021532 [Anisodus tanguticus]|uniref:Uncharacterized protein n=1 Tax=Anisodus tanguticus TaxID=243964 RepID=A0AAE1V7D4_9SOLA|nr:hypothetical protein RND71_021532 [Anisodus tanguticus]
MDCSAPTSPYPLEGTILKEVENLPNIKFVEAILRANALFSPSCFLYLCRPGKLDHPICRDQPCETVLVYEEALHNLDAAMTSKDAIGKFPDHSNALNTESHISSHNWSLSATKFSSLTTMDCSAPTSPYPLEGTILKEVENLPNIKQLLTSLHTVIFAMNQSSNESLNNNVLGSLSQHGRIESSREHENQLLAKAAEMLVPIAKKLDATAKMAQSANTGSNAKAKMDISTNEI